MPRPMPILSSEVSESADHATHHSVSEGSISEARLRAIIREELQAQLTVEQEDDQALLTARETAALLRVDERTLRRMVVEGSVPAPIRIGRRTIRWDGDSLRKSLGLRPSG